jgi:hypothetical protein
MSDRGEKNLCYHLAPFVSDLVKQNSTIIIILSNQLIHALAKDQRQKLLTSSEN